MRSSLRQRWHRTRRGSLPGLVPCRSLWAKSVKRSEDRGRSKRTSICRGDEIFNGSDTIVREIAVVCLNLTVSCRPRNTSRNAAIPKRSAPGNYEMYQYCPRRWPSQYVLTVLFDLLVLEAQTCTFHSWRRIAALHRIPGGQSVALQARRQPPSRQSLRRSAGRRRPAVRGKPLR